MASVERALPLHTASRGTGLTYPSSLTVVAVLVALAIALPVLVVLQNVFVPSQGTWRHLVQTVLGDYVLNSLLLMAGVAVGVIVGGVLTAWITTMCRFPGRRVFEWALLLPMAMPAYVMA